jgi:hypothetical protein
MPWRSPYPEGPKVAMVLLVGMLIDYYRGYPLLIDASIIEV